MHTPNAPTNVDTPVVQAHEKDIATKAELARILKINVQTIDKHPRRFPRFKLGPLVRFHVPSVIAHLRAAADAPGAAKPEAV